jgi:hypothetical protein
MYKVSFFTFIMAGFLSLPVTLSAQGSSYPTDQSIHYDDHCYRSNIKTIQLHQTNWKFSPPVIELNSQQRLELDFDDLDGDVKSYYYTIIHCNADWTPSDISVYDYVKGFPQNYFTNYANSYNTFQKYMHYWVNIPNRDMQILLSGNYILKVYLDNNPDSVVFTRRFMVYENLVGIHAKEKQAMGEDMYTKQEIVFTINTNNYNITDPNGSFNVFILQNDRWDNAISTLKPSFIEGNSLEYTMDDGNEFDGGNQFRNFDMTSLQYNTEHIETMIKNPNIEELQLKKDDPRPASPYFTFPDINGQYYILTKDADSTPINSEYVLVHFFIPMDTEITTGKLYIFGQLSDWQCKDEYVMHYDKDKGGYVGEALLKQGYYDYEYVFLKKGAHVADATVIEGNHYETENQYYIYAYNRDLGMYYDRLVGYTSFHAPSN